MKLHKSKSEFKEAVQAAAKHFGIREVFVEKDYWVTYVLKNLHLSKHADLVVFKGGTSISKAYGIAKRFSEDIDLAIMSKKTSSKQKSADQIKVIEKAIALPPLKEKVDLRKASKNKVYRQTHWDYPRRIDGKHDPAKEKLMLEMITNAKTSPNIRMEIRSLIADFLLATSRTSEINEFELQPFKVKVLSYKRTFAEKVVAVANASLKDDDFQTLRRKIRHLYDLTLLIEESEIKDFVRSESFAKMVNDARAGDKKIPGLKDVAMKSWKSAEIFQKPRQSLAKLKSTYENELGPLVFDKTKMPKMSTIERMLKFVSEESN